MIELNRNRKLQKYYWLSLVALLFVCVAKRSGHGVAPIGLFLYWGPKAWPVFTSVIISCLIASLTFYLLFKFKKEKSFYLFIAYILTIIIWISSMVETDAIVFTLISSVPYLALMGHGLLKE